MSDAATYLRVPFAEKNEARALGAKWDPVGRAWYVPSNVDVALFTRWLGGETGTGALTHRSDHPVTDLPHNRWRHRCSEPVEVYAQRSSGGSLPPLGTNVGRGGDCRRRFAREPSFSDAGRKRSRRHSSGPGESACFQCDDVSVVRKIRHCRWAAACEWNEGSGAGERRAGGRP